MGFAQAGIGRLQSAYVDRAGDTRPHTRREHAAIEPDRARPAVHPRVCGERTTTPVGGTQTIGSSPRVRGTRARARCDHREHRFIPACAGNTLNHAQTREIATVHPRVCGERTGSIRQAQEPDGSSPRARGTRKAPMRASYSRRFIPACAGNAWHARARPWPWAVHPRVCGERRRSQPLRRDAGGSSPRVRGTRHRACPPAARGRFIPACAGCSCNIEMTPLCKIEVTLPRVLGSREVRRGGGVDERAGVQPA